MLGGYFMLSSYIHKCTCTYNTYEIRIYTHIYVCVYIYVYMYVCMYIYVCVYIYMYVYIYIYIYIHTHTCWKDCLCSKDWIKLLDTRKFCSEIQIFSFAERMTWKFSDFTLSIPTQTQWLTTPNMANQTYLSKHPQFFLPPNVLTYPHY